MLNKFNEKAQKIVAVAESIAFDFVMIRLSIRISFTSMKSCV